MLRQSIDQESYRAMFENAGVGITRVDLQGALADVNAKFCELVGYTRDELLGRPLSDLTHPDDYGQGANFRDQFTSGVKSTATGEKRFVRKDASIAHARRALSIVRNADDQPQFAISPWTNEWACAA